MHVGRVYPFAWRFWATTCYFWPGYVPSQMLLPDQREIVPPWSALDSLGDLLSTVADYVPDSTQVFWKWENIGPGAEYSLTVSIEEEEISGIDFAVWNAVLKFLSVPIGTLWYFLPSPQFTVQETLGPWWTSHDPFETPTGPLLVLRPGLYTDGAVVPPPS
jgi:hypothetical protein